VFVYRLKENLGQIHIDYTEARTGRRRGKWISYATYTYIAPQPDDGTVRNTESWRAWCLAEKAKLQA
jgi:hypothetical protein